MSREVRPVSERSVDRQVLAVAAPTAAYLHAEFDPETRIATVGVTSEPPPEERAAFVRQAENLFPTGLRDAHSAAERQWYHDAALIANLGLAVGSVISWSGEVRWEGDGSNLRIRLAFLDTSKAVLANVDSTPLVNSTDWTYTARENVTIPAGTVYVTSWLTASSGALANRRGRRMMLNEGPVALPVEAGDYVLQAQPFAADDELQIIRRGSVAKIG